MLPIFFEYIKTPIFVSENTADKYQVEAQGGMPNTPGLPCVATPMLLLCRFAAPLTTGCREARYIDYLRNILAGSLSTEVLSGGLLSGLGTPIFSRLKILNSYILRLAEQIVRFNKSFF